MSQRQPVKSLPHGSPSAGPVRVSKVPKGWTPYETPWEASVEFVRVDKPWSGGLTPAGTLKRGRKAEWVQTVDPNVLYEGKEDET